MIHGTQILVNSITKDLLSLVDPVSNLDPVTKQYLIAYIQNSMFTQNWKLPVRVATSININLAAPGASLDGVALVIGESFLAIAQSTGSQNGAYIFNGAGVPATRRTDFDGSGEVIDGALFPINEGTLADKYYKLTTNNPITIGTTSLTFSDIIPTSASIVPTASNKDMTASLTASDFDVACATAIVGTPGNDGYVGVAINGLMYTVGDGVKTKSCYFSADSGATAKSIVNIATGDKLYWVGSVAGHQLLATFKVDFYYNV